MHIESLDFFYLSMPEVLDIGDGSQDALLVRVRAGGFTGWGECEASPLTSIAGLVCPMSHSACRPVQDSVLGQRLSDPEDIFRIGNLVRERSLDLLQTDHILSGIDIALWDLMGRKLEEPVYRLLGYERSYPKTAYASVLFGDDPQQTREKAASLRSQGFRAIKFGWGPFGRGHVSEDEEQVRAAREGLGPDGVLLVDAGTVWGEDVDKARLRLNVLQECRATWLEEPFASGALGSYAQLAGHSGSVRLAGGEGCHNYHQAQQFIESGAVGFLQIDTGRIGGISPAKRAADLAATAGVNYVNHTFTSHLALSASLQPYAGVESADICEYPMEPKPLAWEITRDHLLPNENGQLEVPDSPGLGLTPDVEALQKYLVDVEIRVGGKVLYTTLELSC